MRQIKFRGKHLGKWIYGSLIQDGENNFRIVNAFNEGGTYDWYEVDAKTIGQLSDFIDSEGKEVYEGDVIAHPQYYETPEMSHNPKQHGVVEFKDCAFRLYDEILSDDDKDNNDYFYVAGNIHDNPELCGGKN